jgi:hypothetical protein
MRPVSDAQVRKLMEELTKHGQLGRAAMKSDMDRKTARKYMAAGKLPSEMKAPRDWRTRPDPFVEHWPDVQARLEAAQDRVPEREREQHIGVDDDDEGRRDHRPSGRTRLLPFGVVPAELLRHLRKLAKACAAILVALVLELQHILDPQPPMLAGLAERDAPLIEKSHEVLTRHVEEVRGLLCGHLTVDRHDGDPVAARENLGHGLEHVADRRGKLDARPCGPTSWHVGACRFGGWTIPPSALDSAAT